MSSTRKNVKTTKVAHVSTKQESTPVAAVVSEPVSEEIPRNESISDLSVDTTVSASAPKKARIVITRDSIIASFDEIISLIETEIDSLKDSQNKTKGIKFLRTANKKIKTLKNHASRIIKQKSSKKSTPNTNSGFQKPVQISKEMAKFAGWNVDELKSRVQVTQVLCNYIKENNLQNPKDKRQIISDAKLTKLLKYDKTKDEPLTYFRLQTMLKSHFPKSESAVAVKA